MAPARLQIQRFNMYVVLGYTFAQIRNITRMARSAASVFSWRGLLIS